MIKTHTSLLGIVKAQPGRHLYLLEVICLPTIRTFVLLHNCTISYQSCRHLQRRKRYLNPPPLSWRPRVPAPPPPSPLLWSPSFLGHGALAWQQDNFTLVVLNQNMWSDPFGSSYLRSSFRFFFYFSLSMVEWQRHTSTTSTQENKHLLARHTVRNA